MTPYADPGDPRRLERKRRWARRRYRERKRLGIERLGGECVDCGEADPDALQFDHRDPDRKRFGVLRNWWRELEGWLEEVDRCELRCGPCHRRRTLEEGHAGRWANRPWESEAR